MNKTLLQRLADESDLRDLIHRYAFGLDTKDWVLWRSVFADWVVMDMSDYQPRTATASGTRRPGRQERCRAVCGLERSQHFIGSHRYKIDGDRATITAHMRAEHWLDTGKGGDRYTMFGTYTDDAIRTTDGWKLIRVKLALLREEGNRSLMREAVRRSRDETPNEAAGAAAGAV